MKSKRYREVMYLCDRKACSHCNSECNFTRDVSHAKNFEIDLFGKYRETIFAPTVSEEYKQGYFKGYIDGTNSLIKELLTEEKRISET